MGKLNWLVVSTPLKKQPTSLIPRTRICNTIHLHYINKMIGSTAKHTVDARNPAPPWMIETLWIMEKTIYQLVQDFFHPQYQQPLNVRFVHCQPETETADAQIQLKPC